MSMNLTLNLIACGLLLALAIAVSVYRNWLEEHCDHYIHLHNDSHDATLVQGQSALCRRLEVMDKLKIGLITATIVYALVIVGIASYSAWNSSGM